MKIIDLSYYTLSECTVNPRRVSELPDGAMLCGCCGSTFCCDSASFYEENWGVQLYKEEVPTQEVNTNYTIVNVKSRAGTFALKLRHVGASDWFVPKDEEDDDLDYF